MPLYVAEFQFRYNNRENVDIFRDGDRGMLGRAVAIGALALVVATYWGLVFALQPPSPRDFGTSRPPHSEAQSDQETATDQPRGTERIPLIVRTVKSKEEAAQDTRDREDKASTDWWMKIFSAAVAIAAVLQFGTFVLMIRTSRTQL